MVWLSLWPRGRCCVGLLQVGSHGEPEEAGGLRGQHDDGGGTRGQHEETAGGTGSALNQERKRQKQKQKDNQTEPHLLTFQPYCCYVHPSHEAVTKQSFNYQHGCT